MIVTQLKIYAGPRELIAIVVRMVCRSLRTGRDGKGHGPGSSKAKVIFPQEHQDSISIATLSLLVYSKQDQLLFSSSVVSKALQTVLYAVRSSLLLNLPIIETYTVGSFRNRFGYCTTSSYCRFFIAFKVLTKFIPNLDLQKDFLNRLPKSTFFITLNMILYSIILIANFYR